MSMQIFADLYMVPSPTYASRKYDAGLRHALIYIEGEKFNTSAPLPFHASMKVASLRIDLFEAR